MTVLAPPLMKVLRVRFGDDVRFEGVGGSSMAREGLQSLFPIEELSIIGLGCRGAETAVDPEADQARNG